MTQEDQVQQRTLDVLNGHNETKINFALKYQESFMKKLLRNIAFLLTPRPPITKREAMASIIKIVKVKGLEQYWFIKTHDGYFYKKYKYNLVKVKPGFYKGIEYSFRFESIEDCKEEIKKYLDDKFPIITRSITYSDSLKVVYEKH